MAGHDGRSVAAQVRNAAGGIVQLVYGEDGLDPVGMEARDGGPVDFPRAVQVVAARERPPDEGMSATLKHHLKVVALYFQGSAASEANL